MYFIHRFRTKAASFQVPFFSRWKGFERDRFTGRNNFLWKELLWKKINVREFFKSLTDIPLFKMVYGVGPSDR